MPETVYGFGHDEFVAGFRHLGLGRDEALEVTERLFHWSPTTGAAYQAATVLEPDILAALSLVSLDCERRARAALESLPAAARVGALVRFRRARLSLGGRPE